jgi:hypothetical protein
MRLAPRLVLLLLFAGAVSARAKDTDYRSYFTYPDTQVTVDFGDGHAVAIPFKNHSIPRNSSETPFFRCGHEEQGPGYSSRVQWRFVEKTETGDLYMVSIYKSHSLVKEAPVLYTGATLVAYDWNHIKVTLEPTGSAKWKAP